jgi:hypothetical protein
MSWNEMAIAPILAIVGIRGAIAASSTQTEHAFLQAMFNGLPQQSWTKRNAVPFCLF